ncbi:MAG: EAL domain-containing protein [Pacificimonas sp.]
MLADRLSKTAPRADDGPVSPRLTLSDRCVADAASSGLILFRQTVQGEMVCVDANRLANKWMGLEMGSAIGLALHAMPFLTEVPLLSSAVTDAFDDQTLHGEIQWTSTCTDEPRPLAATVASVDNHALLTIRDRTRELQSERHLRLTMTSDQLTGLPNRCRFAELIDQAIEERGETHIAVLHLNVDRFKRVNDSLGQVAGDEYLIALASRLQGCTRGDDELGRIGGDEFGLLIVGLSAETETEDLVARVRERLEQPFRLSGGEVHATVSIGIATTGSSQPNADDLLRDANFALAQARRDGVGGQQIYEADDHDRARARFVLEADLREAIGTDQLTIVYQPIVDLGTGTICGVEALSRWECPDRGFVAPTDFIPLAEESGLIVPLGRQMLVAACREAAASPHDLRTLNEEMRLSVNISSVQLARDDIVGVVKQTLAETGLSGDRLRIELTESSIVANPKRAARLLGELKALGCSIAMDDFGTGYSSLSYLQSLPIDVLKIDRSFVTGILASADSRKIIDAIVSLARALGMKTVAEGVETAEQRLALRDAGCDMGQGYFFSHPLNREHLVEHLCG